MDILKNPIVIGLTAGALTYGYLTMGVNERNEKNSKQKKRGKKTEKESVNLLIPLVVGIIAWFLAYAYFEYSGDNSNTTYGETNNILKKVPPLPLPLPPSPKYNFIKDVVSESSEPRAYTLVTQGVNVPQNIPDVLMDMY